MSALLTFDTVSARTPENTPLFNALSLSIGTERVGLVGRNGTGKSTLLGIAAGHIAPFSGAVRRTGTLGLLAQDWPGAFTLAEALGVAEGLARLARITSGAGDEADFAAADWTLEARIAAALARTGLGAMALERAMGTLSGGERMRVGIARLEIARPDLIVLDEPTNNLDAAGRAAIGALIAGWPGGVLVASHDRALLETMDRIVELTPVGVTVVGGGWSDFVRQREAERLRASSALERSEEALREAQRAAQRQREAQARRDRAGRAAGLKGSEPKILLGRRAERAEASTGKVHRLGDRQMEDAAHALEMARARVEVTTPLTIALPRTGLSPGTRLLALEAVTAERDGRRLGPWTLAIDGPERVAVAGPNGAGKTTLLKIAAGLVEPEGGTVRRHAGRIGFLDQHLDLLDPAGTVLANLLLFNPGLDTEAAHAAAARFAFRNRDAQRIVGTLSGGERLRAGLAALLAGPDAPALLILDEPTNHLDIASVELLERALAGHDGALLVVSHDEAFLEAIGITRRIALDESVFRRS